jgi:WD40 repeat protein
MFYDRNASEQINFMAHDGFIRALEFHGDLLASASADATIKLWDIREIVRRHRSGRGLKADSSPITCIASGEQYIYAGSAGGTCIKWSKQFSAPDAPLPQFAYDRQDRYDAGDGIHDMDVCPNGNLLAVSDSSLLEIGADLGGSQSLPTDDSYRLVRTIDDRYAVVCGESFALYDRKKGRLKKLKGFPLRTCLDLSRDKSTAIVALEPIRGAELEVWNIKRGKLIKTLTGHFQNSGAACCLLSPDGKKAVSSGVRDRTIILWNVGRGVPVSAIDFAHEMETFTLYSEEQSIKIASWGDLRYVVSYALMEPVVKLWDMNTGERLAEINIDFKPTAMRAIADGIIAIGASTGELMLFQIEMGQGGV